jgi:SAM-dependent methyltransferase
VPNPPKKIDNFLKSETLTNKEHRKEHYKQWAATYDEDLTHKAGYIVHHQALPFFTKYVSVESTVLDAGSGTGLMGAVLKKAGYTQIEALDISEEMLEYSSAKNLYQAYHLGVLGESLEFKTNTYDAVVSIGAFGPTHAPPHSFEELIRIIKPGGYLLFTMRENEIPQGGDFRIEMKRLTKQASWTLVEESACFEGFTENKTLLFKGFVYQIT